MSSPSIRRCTRFAEALHNTFIRTTSGPFVPTRPSLRPHQRSFVTQQHKLSSNGLDSSRETFPAAASNGTGPKAPAAPAKSDSQIFGPDLPSVVYDVNITDQVVDAILPDGRHSPNVTIPDLRRRFNPFIYRLVQVVPATEASRMKCAVMDQATFIRYVMKNAPNRATATVMTSGGKIQGAKELEMSWAITDNDLEHKMRSLQDFLGKGKRVQINIAPKRRGRVPTTEEGEQLIATIKEKVAEVPGASECKTPDGEPLKMYSLHFRGGTPSDAGVIADDAGHSKRHEKKLRWLAQASERTAEAARSKS